MRQLLLSMSKDDNFPIVGFVWRAFLFSIRFLLTHSWQGKNTKFCALRMYWSTCSPSWSYCKQTESPWATDGASGPTLPTYNVGARRLRCWRTGATTERPLGAGRHIHFKPDRRAQKWAASTSDDFRRASGSLIGSDLYALRRKWEVVRWGTQVSENLSRKAEVGLGRWSQALLKAD